MKGIISLYQVWKGEITGYNHALFSPLLTSNIYINSDDSSKMCVHIFIQAAKISATNRPDIIFFFFILKQMVIKALSLMINRQNKSYDECIV
jgi:hypothetical protein